MQADAWGCPVLPPTQAHCFSFFQVGISELKNFTLFLFYSVLIFDITKPVLTFIPLFFNLFVVIDANEIVDQTAEL